jgi:adenylate kinase family enzyme
MSKLIIVCGMPGVGKTTLAKELSKKINTLCLHKDSIKENLYDIMEGRTLDDSKKIGFQSLKLMFKLIEEQIARGIDIIIEGPFYIKADAELFHEWQKQYNLDVTSIICEIEEKLRKERFINRFRHASHHDQERIAYYQNKQEPWWVFDVNPNYKEMPGQLIRIKTNRAVEELVEEIMNRIN